MLGRCAVLVTMMGLVACSGANSSGLFDSENNATETDAGPKSLGSKNKKDGGADGGAAGDDTRAGDGGTLQKDASTASACTVANITFGKTACDTCSLGACCTQWKTCDKNADCVQLLQCAVKCAGDQECVQTCVFLHPDGKDDVVAVYDCQNKGCAAQCK